MQEKELWLNAEQCKPCSSESFIPNSPGQYLAKPKILDTIYNIFFYSELNLPI